VYANEIVTKVIGTSFKITAINGEKSIKVIVKTGKVSVYRLKELKKTEKKIVFEGVVIIQNQQIVFDKDDSNFTKTLVSEPELMVLSKFDAFDFKDTSAPDIFKTIQNAYGVSIIFDEDVLKECTVTASLTDEPLYEKLNLICLAIEAEYEVIDGQIIISSKGCK
jgi:transmembrane sensor